LKKNKKRKQHGKSKRHNFKTEKKTGNKINGEKKHRQKGENMGKKWNCPFAFFPHLPGEGC